MLIDLVYTFGLLTSFTYLLSINVHYWQCAELTRLSIAAHRINCLSFVDNSYAKFVFQQLKL